VGERFPALRNEISAKLGKESVKRLETTHVQVTYANPMCNFFGFWGGTAEEMGD
jgi:hypothetical protein